VYNHTVHSSLRCTLLLSPRHNRILLPNIHHVVTSDSLQRRRCRLIHHHFVVPPVYKRANFVLSLNTLGTRRYPRGAITHVCRSLPVQRPHSRPTGLQRSPSAAHPFVPRTAAVVSWDGGQESDGLHVSTVCNKSIGYSDSVCKTRRVRVGISFLFYQST
jgi:hypothetical protein